MASHLLNIDETLAHKVAGKLGLQKPKPADAAVATHQDLDPSPALGIVENGPERFEGRKLYSVSGGSDGGLLKALKAPRDKDGASYEIIAPKVTGLEASDGSWVEAEQMIHGGPSVLYDAVALLPARMRWTTCSKNPRHAISSPIPSRTASDRVRRSCTFII